jgi:hypothetical protein
MGEKRLIISIEITHYKQIPMQLTGRIVSLLPMQTGTGRNGTWRKQEVILETEGQYPKKVCVAVWGDRIDEQQLQMGNNLKVDVDVESREYNGRWYTDVKAWRVEVVAPGSVPAAQPNNAGYAPAPQSPASIPSSQQYINNMPGSAEDDMPF